ncbi:hypothetical protein Hanom_Chr09g00761491 [Helianthus anomalus]
MTKYVWIFQLMVELCCVCSQPVETINYVLLVVGILVTWRRTMAGVNASPLNLGGSGMGVRLLL